MKSLALNMLVWNEVDLLSGALNSVMPYVSEAHIIDTGSTDNTMRILEVAKEVWPKLEYEQIDVQHLGEVWTGSKKDNKLTQLLNELKFKTKSEWILKVDSDEVFPKETMEEIMELVPTEDFYILYFRHFQEDSILDPKSHKKLRALRLFKNTPEIHWTGRYGTETITKGLTKIPTRKCQALKNPFLHFGSYREKRRRHEYNYDLRGHHTLVPIPFEYLKYVPYNS